jgi:hypothetical protein
VPCFRVSVTGDGDTVVDSVTACLEEKGWKVIKAWWPWDGRGNTVEPPMAQLLLEPPHGTLPPVTSKSKVVVSSKLSKSSSWRKLTRFLSAGAACRTDYPEGAETTERPDGGRDR